MLPVSSTRTFDVHTVAFEQRFETLTEEQHFILSNNPELKVFLKQAIDFLSVADNAVYSENVAHYLMGKVSYLPKGLDELVYEFSDDVKNALYGLLRTHRYDGIVGRMEAPDKTRAKLEALFLHLTADAAFIPESEQMQSWLNQAPEEEREARYIAVERIADAVFTKYLSLAGLQLTTLPPLPSDLEVLDLFHNQLQSLAGIPQQITERATCMIDLSLNPLTQATIDSINNHTYQARIRGSFPEPLDREVQKWFPKVNTNVWKDYIGTREGAALAKLLMRLHCCESFSKTERASSITELKLILTRMSTDATFREHCFEAVLAGDGSCSDDAQAVFDSLRMLMADPATKTQATLKQVVSYQNGLLAEQMIDEYVEKNINKGDKLESGMLLKEKLSQDLEMPIRFKGIRYVNHAYVANNLQLYKTKVKEYVLTNKTSDRLAKAMADNSNCANFLKKTYSVMTEAQRMLWEDACEHAKGNDKSGAVIEGESKLQAARKLQIGDGKNLHKLWSVADKEFLEKIAKHAVDNQTMTQKDRKRWEIDQLLCNEDWRLYFEEHEQRNLSFEDWTINTLNLSR